MKKQNNRVNGAASLQKNADAETAVALVRLVQECHRIYADYRKLEYDSVGGCLWLMRKDGRLQLAVPVGDYTSSRSQFFLRKATNMVGCLSAQVYPVAGEAKAYGIRSSRGFLVFTGDIGSEGCQALVLLVAELSGFEIGTEILKEAFSSNLKYRTLREQFLTREPGSKEFLSSI